MNTKLSQVVVTDKNVEYIMHDLLQRIDTRIEKLNLLNNKIDSSVKEIQENANNRNNRQT